MCSLLVVLIQEDRKEQASIRPCQVKGWAETNTAVSFTVYSSTPERGTMHRVLSVGTVLPLFAVVQKKVTCVNSREARQGLDGMWGKQIFYTLQKHILFSCASETKRLYRILGVVVKTKQKQKKKKKVVVPNTMMPIIQRHRHFVEVQVFRMEGLQIS